MEINSIVRNEFIEQTPGLFIVVDKESKFLAANKTALSWTGFKSRDTMIGETYANMLCKAAQQHEFFTQQDQMTIERNKPLRILGYYCYANNDWKVLLGEKYPIRNNNNEIIAVVLHFNDITHDNIIDLTKFLDITVRKHSIKIQREQVNCILENNYPAISLPQRQSECLFFLLRGKTVKEIAKILNLSPRTIESYMEQIKYKLNCSTKSEVIEKAIAKGYMNIIPSMLLRMLK